MATTDLVSVLLWVAQDLEERHGYQYSGAVRMAARKIRELETTAPGPDACERCGTPIDQKPLGRRRRYCTERCRKRAGNANLRESKLWTRESA
jgi:endogenous inhibitor of DNA gyrase (YacG/DUF329 family)